MQWFIETFKISHFFRDRSSSTVCVCAPRQNTNLMLEGVNIKKLAADHNMSFNIYKHWIAQMMCNPAQPSCYLGECRYCPGDRNLRIQLEHALSERFAENIAFKQWVLSIVRTWKCLLNQQTSLGICLPNKCQN